MTFEFSAINWLAVLVAAVASFVLGGLWYTALFGKAWQRAYGYSEEELKKMGQHPERTFPTMFACDFVIAAAVALLVVKLEINGGAQGVVLGAFLWVGVIGAGMLATSVGSGKPLAGWAIDAGKHLASLVVIGSIVGAWR